MSTPSITSSRYIKGKKIAEQLDITPETLKSWCDRGMFNGFSVDKTFVVEIESFTKFFEEHSNKRACEDYRRTKNSPRK